MAKFRLTRIEPPDWATQPDVSIAAVTVSEYAAIQRHRDKLLRAVHREVEAYLNTPGLYGEGESFPDRLRMTGAYYVGAESYIAHRDPAWFRCGTGDPRRNNHGPTRASGESTTVAAAYRPIHGLKSLL